MFVAVFVLMAIFMAIFVITTFCRILSYLGELFYFESEIDSLD